MKKLLFLLLFLSVLTSCKKYDMCCKTTAYDNLNDNQFVSEDCNSDMSKKERDNFKYHNNAQKAYDNIKGFPSRYENKKYTCY